MKILGHADVRALSEQTGRPIKDLIALARDNDPFIGDLPGGARTKWARWFADLWTRLNIPHGAHLRRIHYVLVSTTRITLPDGQPYLNTYNCWKYLGDAATDARYQGLVPYEAIVDRRSEAPVEHIQGTTQKRIAFCPMRPSTISTVLTP